MCLAVPGKIININGDEQIMRTGKVSFGGLISQVSLACVPDADIGDYVIVHAGLAISVVDEKEADRIFELIQQLQPVMSAEDATE